MSRRRSNIFFTATLLTIFSLWLAWQFVEDSTDYEYENYEEHTPVMSAPTVSKDDSYETNYSTWDVNSDCSLSLNHLLWSRLPSNANWSETEEMCNTILNRSHPLHDITVLEAQNWTVPDPHSEESMINLLSNCSQFLRLVQFPDEPASEKEAQFPLAYVFVGARNAAQTVRLFRMLYQPQNIYCLTYDNKTSEGYKTVIRRLVECLPGDNVFLTPEPEPIYYTDYSILHSCMVCLKALLDRHKSIAWRYVQIVSWNDIPLRTNAEMVRIFEILNGSQDSALERITEEFFVFDHNLKGDIVPHVHRTVVPDGLSMYKGSYATSMTKEFVQFVFENPSSVRLYEWLEGGKCAEEQYWATMIHNLQLNPPGGFPGQCYYFYAMRGKKKPFLSRYQIWKWSREKCSGKMTNFSCVYGTNDLAKLIERPELIAHKLYEEFQPAAPFCLEYWFWRRRCSSSMILPEDYYQDLPSVRYHHLKNRNDFICY